MDFRKISLKDKGIFEEYLNLKGHKLSAYSFANIYVWGRLFDISWSVIDSSLCVFFRDKISTFLYLPPLCAGGFNPRAVNTVFNILARLNKNKLFSHIDNIEAEEEDFYREIGYECLPASHEYFFLQGKLAQLKGGNFKSKRANCNFFRKHYDYVYTGLTQGAAKECLELYKAWAEDKKRDIKDHLCRGMLGDSFVVLKEAFKNYSALGFKGAAVKISGRLCAFTFGYAINKYTFCILYEIADLSFKGLAQFIFREFSEELKEYKFVNIMDDSGIDGLKRSKLSYHPEALVASYSARLKNGQAY